MFNSYDYANKLEIEDMVMGNYDYTTDFVSNCAYRCVSNQIKMCCFFKTYPGLPRSSFKRRVHSKLRGDGDGKSVYFFFSFFLCCKLIREINIY
jgi:hypothetical protein